MMIRFSICIAIASLLIASCTKTVGGGCPYTTSSVIAPAAESDSLQTLLTDSGIVATKNTVGFYYRINQPGAATTFSNLCQSVSVTYKGTFFNGAVFDSTAAGQMANFQLGEVILGWQKGVQLIGKGGDITLYIPPSLAYGSTPVGDNTGDVVIPASSYLIYNIHLIDVQ